MTTSTDYTGRRVDLSLFPTILSASIPVIGQISSNPRVVAGLSALAQNFARILLTPLGNYRSDPLMGSKFFEGISTKTLRFPTDLQHLFLIESDRVAQYMASHYRDDTPLDEQLLTATLSDIEMGTTSVGMTIEIVSRAGSTVKFLLPVNWNL